MKWKKAIPDSVGNPSLLFQYFPDKIKDKGSLPSVKLCSHKAQRVSRVIQK